VLHVAAGYRYPTVTSLNWQGDVAPDADFNPLRYALVMAGGAACSCLASLDVTPVSHRPAAITFAQAGLCHP
jgi:hypothetical protein